MKKQIIFFSASQKKIITNNNLKYLSDIHLPFSRGAFLYFSNLLTAIASRRTLAAGYSFRTSHISFLLNTKRSLYPTERTLAVLRLPIFFLVIFLLFLEERKKNIYEKKFKNRILYVRRKRNDFLRFLILNFFFMFQKLHIIQKFLKHFANGCTN